MSDETNRIRIVIDPSGAVVGARDVRRATDSISAGARGATDAVRGTESSLDQLRRSALAAGSAITAAMVLRKLISETSQAQAAMAQLEVAVRSTGSAAGRSVAELDKLSSALQQVTVFGDEAIKGAMSRLLAYTSIQGQTFDRATRAVLDFATSFRMDLSSAAEAVGKALEYPERATEALSRQGYRFSEAQQAMLKQMVDTGRIAEAQALILSELEVATKGAAEAARNTLGGALSGLRNAFGDLFEVTRESSGGVINAIEGITRAVVVVGENMGKVFTAASLLAALFAGRYVASILAAVAAWNAKRAAMQAEAALAVQAIQRDQMLAANALRAAQARLTAARVSSASAAQLAVAENAVASAQLRVSMTANAATAAQAKLAATSSILTGVMARTATAATAMWVAIGGPIGLGIAALAGAVLIFKSLRDRGDDVASAMRDAKTETDRLRDSLESLTRVQIENKMSEVRAILDDIRNNPAGGSRDVAGHLVPVFSPEQLASLIRFTGQLRELGARLKTLSGTAKETSKAFQEAHADRALELDRLRATNAAYGQSALELAKLNLEYDARAQKSKDARTYQGAELAAMNSLTDAITKQKIEALELVEAQRKDKQWWDYMLRNAGKVVEIRNAMNETRVSALTGFEYTSVKPIGRDATAINPRPLADAFREASGDAAVAAAEAAKVMEEIWTQAIRSVQSTFADGFNAIFRDGITGFRDMAAQVVNVFRRAASEIAAALTVRALGLDDAIAKIKDGAGSPVAFGRGAVAQSQANRAAGASATGSAGTTAMVGAAMFAGITTAVGSFVGFLNGMGDKAREAAIRMKQARDAWVRTMEDFAAIADPLSDLQRQLRDLERQAVSIATSAAASRGVNVGGIQGIGDVETFIALLKSMSGVVGQSGLVRDLEQLIAQYKANAEAVRVLNAEMQAQLQEDLQIRALRASGRSEEAEAAALALRHSRELASAQKNYDAATIALMEYVHALEASELAAKQAADRERQRASFAADLAIRSARLEGRDGDAELMRTQLQHAEEARAAAKLYEDGIISVEQLAQFIGVLNGELQGVIDSIREAAELRAVMTQRAMEDLDVRMLAAQGMDAEADARRIELAQRREIEDAIRDSASDEYIARLREVIAAETDLIAARQAEAEAMRAQQQAFQRSQFGLSLDAREANLAGDDESALRARMSASAERELDEARRLVEEGTITAEMFERLARILDGELNKALADMANAAEEAAAAALKARNMALEDLEVRRLVALGDNDAAEAMRFNLRQQREYIDALTSGMDEFFLATLAQVHELERAAWEAAQKQVNAVATDSMGALRGGAGAQETTRGLQALSESTGLSFVNLQRAAVHKLDMIERNTAKGGGNAQGSTGGGHRTITITHRVVGGTISQDDFNAKLRAAMRVVNEELGADVERDARVGVR